MNTIIRRGATSCRRAVTTTVLAVMLSAAALAPLAAQGGEAVPAQGGGSGNESSPTSWLHYRGDATYELGLVRTSDSLFNPSGRLLPVANVDHLLRLNGDVGVTLSRVRIRARGGAEVEHANSRRADASMRELTASLSLGPVEISGGRKILRWSNGYAFTPAGLLDPLRDPADPQDRLGRLKGRELVQADYYRGSQTFTVVFSSPDLFWNPRVEPATTGAARYNVTVGGVDLAVIAAHRFKARTEAAITGNYVVGDRIGIHAEIAAARGTDTLFPASIGPGTDRMLVGPDFLLPLKRNDRRLFARYLAGVNYTFPTGINAIVEYYHADDGLSSIEWERFLDQAQFSRRLADARGYPAIVDGHSLPELNLMQAAQALGARAVRQNYLFARIASPRIAGRIDATAMTLWDVADGSAVVVPDVSVNVDRRWAVYGRGGMYMGNSHSEFGNVPYGPSLTLGVRFFF